MPYRRVRGNLKPEYLRLKEAMTVFSMGPEKIEALARECGAYYKVDKVVLINYEALRDYIETFREN